MDAQTWQLISIIGYSLAGLLFIVAIIMFIKMNIWSVIGDLTGRTAAKQIQEIREQNARTGNKHYRPSAFNLERGKLTEPVGSRKLGRKGGTTRGLRKFMTRGLTQETSRPGITQNLQTDRLPKNVPVYQQYRGPVFEDTTVLTDPGVPMADETTVLGSEVASTVEETTVLGNEIEFTVQETSILGDEVESSVDATTVLGSANDIFVEATSVLDARKDRFGEKMENPSSGTQVLDQGTDLLPNETVVPVNGTEVLIDGTDVLNDGADEFDRGTEVLSQDMGTTVLNPTEELTNEEFLKKAVDFKVVKDIKIIHTDRVI
ncbi:hypothetical protein [Niallia sp. Krafla_26]|uniref:hypothetical protein n=1 Tax=Niallia sp. Krafla_26 TaxID=3064703 RepID=UPI003D1717F3